MTSESETFTFMDFLQRDAILESEYKTKKLFEEIHNIKGKGVIHKNIANIHLIE